MSLAWAVFAIRVAMGAFFLFEAVSQLSQGWLGGDGLAEKLQTSLNDNDIPGPYVWFLENVVLEYDGLFTVLTILGELAVGLGLALGLLTRLSGATALFMNVNFGLMNGLTTVGAIIDWVFVAGALFVIAFASRQALSVDERLARRGFESPLASGNVGKAAASPAHPCG
jgi:uncharacterized membrane protein YphA (DoxX/SURF4 family)